MAKKIKVLGAALVTIDGLCLAGDLGLDTDIDITMAMFSAVSSYVEDTMGEAADQIRLPSMDVSRIKGNYTFLVVTSTGTSEEFLKYAKKVLEIIEGLYQNKLPDWDGQVIEGLEHDFERHVEDLKKWTGKEEKQEVPELGFGVLKKLSLLEYEGVEWEHEINNYVNSLENAYHLYYLSGEHETAYELASKAARILEKRPDDKDSSLFYAYAAKVRVIQRKAESKELLKKARKKAEKQNNLIAMAEVANAVAGCYAIEKKTKKALEWSQKAKEQMRKIGVDSPRKFVRLLTFKQVEILAYSTTGKSDETIKHCKQMLEYIKKCPAGATDIDKLILLKTEISAINDIGYFLTFRDRLNPKNYKEAIPYYESALHKIKERSNVKWSSLFLRNNLAQAYSFTGNFRKARILSEGVLKDAMGIKNDYMIAAAERVQGIYHYLLGKKNNDEDEFYEAIHWFNRALKKQKDSAEIENINFFKKEAQNALKSI